MVMRRLHLLEPVWQHNLRICGTRASASLLSTLEVHDDDLDQGLLGSSICSLFFLLKSCNSVSVKKGKDVKASFGSDDTGCSVQFKDDVSPSRRSEIGCLRSRENPFVDNGVHRGGNSGERKGFLPLVRTCSNMRKDREGSSADGGGGNAGGVLLGLGP